MFDVKPVDETGNVNFEKIKSISTVVNLAVNRERQEIKKVILPDRKSVTEQFETILNQKIDYDIELSRFGAKPKITTRDNIKPEAAIPAPEVPLNELPTEPDLLPALREIYHSARGIQTGDNGDREISVPESNGSGLTTLAMSEEMPAQIYDWIHPVRSSPPKVLRTSLRAGETSYGMNPSLIKSIRKTLRVIFVILVLGSGIFVAGQFGLNLKNRLLEESNSAVSSLVSARENIEKFNFDDASTNFLEAYDEFTKVSSTLNFMGTNLTGLISELPGAGKLKSVQRLVESGRLFADAGQSMTEALSAIGDTSAVLNPEKSKDISMGKVISRLRAALIISHDNISKADTLFANLDLSGLPEEKQASVLSVQAKLPQFKKMLADGVEYSRFLESFIDVKGTKKYLVLFQNASELRPTGGFPGTYGVITFKDGKLEEFKVDDVYNLDGQLKEHIIPPEPLRHITPTWSMRDANWFIDFPNSAKKVMEFFKKESGYEVDGVLTFSPSVLAQILDVVGPIEMPEYNRTFSSANALAEIQAEVEYGPNRAQPKNIVKDLAGALLDRVKTVDSNKWTEIFNIFIDGLERKDILLYSRNLSLESFATDHGFGGQVKNVDADFFMATFTNIKGSKTDVVTDTSIKVDTRWEENNLIHKITLTRVHSGGQTDYGFYNKQNPAYVRVLVPKGSNLRSINNNDNPTYKPLVNYASNGFKKDPDLALFEETARESEFKGVKIYNEAGKTEFGFWMITDPGITKTVAFEYSIPEHLAGSDYKLYIQRQPGLKVSNFELTLNPPAGKGLTTVAPELNKVGDVYTYSNKLEKDLILRASFK